MSENRPKLSPRYAFTTLQNTAKYLLPYHHVQRKNPSKHARRQSTSNLVSTVLNPNCRVRQTVALPRGCARLNRPRHFRQYNTALHEMDTKEGPELVRSSTNGLPPLVLRTPTTEGAPTAAPSYRPTQITMETLSKQPFKTVDRVVDDLRWCIDYERRHQHSMLDRLCLSYASDLSSAAELLTPMLIELLNDLLETTPTVEKTEFPDRKQLLVRIRGVITRDSDNELHHFVFQILEDRLNNPFVKGGKEKHELHVVPLLWLLPDDQDTLTVAGLPPAQDVVFRAANSLSRKTVRVLVYPRELLVDEREPLIQPTAIRSRYMNARNSKYPQLSELTVPLPALCLHYLVRVLRGPLTGWKTAKAAAAAGQTAEPARKSITLADLVLDAQIDLSLLTLRLGFTLSDDGADILAPNLDDAGREQFVRMSLELMWMGYHQPLAAPGMPANPFHRYLYSQNALAIFGHMGEYDPHRLLAYFGDQPREQPPFFTAISAYPFYQDELVIKCYEHTTMFDPDNKLHYVDAMKNIKNFRGGAGSKLASYATMMAGKGEFIGFHEYTSALAQIGVSVLATDAAQVADDAIIALYQAAVADDPRNYGFFHSNLATVCRVRQTPALVEFCRDELVPQRVALSELGVEELTEDDVVITAYEYKLDEIMQSNNFNAQAPEVTLLHRSLLALAIYRKSYLLLSYVENKHPEFLSQFRVNASDAYRTLGCTSEDSDFTLVSQFQQRVAQGDADVRALRAALHLIAAVRDSDILRGFVDTGRIDPLLLPIENWPAGLDNIGNTCYLNSLLQYYFCIKPLRDMILEFDPAKVTVDAGQAMKRKIGGRKVDPAEVERSNQFVAHLAHLFYQMIHSDSRCVAPLKQLAYLAFLPLSQPVQFGTTLTDMVEVDDEDADSDASGMAIKGSSPKILEGSLEVIEGKNPHALISDDEDVNMEEADYSADGAMDEEMHSRSPLETSAPASALSLPSAPTSESTNAPKPLSEHVPSLSDLAPIKGPPQKLLPISTNQIESTIEVGRQQDVTECIENVTYQIETALAADLLDDDGEQIDIIKRLFYGKTKQTIAPLVAGASPRETVEWFFSLIINISDHPKNIYDSLDSYFSEDLVSLEEGECKKLITICQLPEVLQFHVQRVMFDRERLVAYKALDPIPFADHIYLDRYLDTDDAEIVQKRSEVFDWKRKMAELQHRRDEITRVDSDTHMTGLQLLQATHRYLEACRAKPAYPVEVSDELMTTVKDEITRVQNELTEIDAELERLTGLVGHQFDGYTKVGYLIFAIFIHRGEASYGHYWVYIKDPTRDIYRKYNDEIVTEVPALEVFNFSEGNTATPYYIVYVKDNLERDYVEPLKREVE